jgi:hypothetical protein
MKLERDNHVFDVQISNQKDMAMITWESYMDIRFLVVVKEDCQETIPDLRFQISLWELDLVPYEKTVFYSETTPDIEEYVDYIISEALRTY